MLHRLRRNDAQPITLVNLVTSSSSSSPSYSSSNSFNSSQSSHSSRSSRSSRSSNSSNSKSYSSSDHSSPSTFHSLRTPSTHQKPWKPLPRRRRSRKTVRRAPNLSDLADDELPSDAASSSEGISPPEFDIDADDESPLATPHARASSPPPRVRRPPRRRRNTHRERQGVGGGVLAPDPVTVQGWMRQYAEAEKEMVNGDAPHDADVDGLDNGTPAISTEGAEVSSGHSRKRRRASAGSLPPQKRRNRGSRSRKSGRKSGRKGGRKGVKKEKVIKREKAAKREYVVKKERVVKKEEKTMVEPTAKVEVKMWSNPVKSEPTMVSKSASRRH